MQIIVIMKGTSENSILSIISHGKLIATIPAITVSMDKTKSIILIINFRVDFLLILISIKFLSLLIAIIFPFVFMFVFVLVLAVLLVVLLALVLVLIFLFSLCCLRLLCCVQSFLITYILYHKKDNMSSSIFNCLQFVHN